MRNWPETQPASDLARTVHSNDYAALSLSLFLARGEILFFYLVLALLALPCCAQTASREWRSLFAAVRGLVQVVASLVAEHRL